MHIARDRVVGDTAAPVAASSTTMPGAFEFEAVEFEADELPPPRFHPVVCWECHRGSIGAHVCSHRSAALVDHGVNGQPVSDVSDVEVDASDVDVDDAPTSLASFEDYDSDASVGDSLEGDDHQFQTQGVADRPLSRVSEHSSALWVGISPQSSFLVDHPEVMRTPTPEAVLATLPQPIVGQAQAAIATAQAPIAFVMPELGVAAAPATAVQPIPQVFPAARAQPVATAIAAQPVVAAVAPQPVAAAIPVQPVVAAVAPQPVVAAVAPQPVVAAVAPQPVAAAVPVQPVVAAVAPQPGGGAQVQAAAPMTMRAQVNAHLATFNIVPHYDQNDPMFAGRWYVVTRGRTVGVFRHQGTASAATLAFSGQNWFRAKPYEAACEAFYNCALNNGVSNQPAV